MDETRAAELRHWLVEPDYSSEQRRPPEIDGRQRELIENRSATAYRRLRGPAGSGKSLVLAGRAARLAAEGRRVLVASYNITLINYLRDLAVRFGRQGIRDNVEWLHFHLWCKRICLLTGNGESYRELWRARGYGETEADTTDSIIDDELPRLVSAILTDPNTQDAPSYDAILVDEGQDYRPSWWQALRQALRPGGEMLLVADTTQNVYGTARAWTDQAMRGAGFAGRWLELKTSYRLPENFLPLARDFADTYLPADTRIAPEPMTAQLPFPSCELEWIQVASDDLLGDACLTAIERLMTETDSPRPAIADITVIVPTEDIGETVVEGLTQRRLKSIHTFGETSGASRRLKMYFYKGDARVKVTTIKSFKGWESSVIVALIGSGRSEEDLAEAYAALTRVKRTANGSFLSVVCSEPVLRGYGRKWPSFIDFETASPSSHIF